MFTVFLLMKTDLLYTWLCSVALKERVIIFQIICHEMQSCINYQTNC